MPLMKKLKFPANAALVNEEMIQFAFFDLIPTDWLDDIVLYLPETSPYSSAFQMFGYESILFLGNAGFALYVI